MAHKFDTSGLSGYAKAYAEAWNSGASDAQAHDVASRSIGRDTYSYFDSGSSGGSGSGSGVTTAKVGDNPFYAQVYRPRQDDYRNTTDYYKAVNDYSLSLLNPYNLPGFYRDDGSPYSYLKIPQEGKSHSRDIVSPPKFEVDDRGNIRRTDFTVSGETTSLIPNLGGWRKSADGRYDQELGDVYSRQISPLASETRMLRGSNIGATPSWYDPDARKTWLEAALDIAQGKGGDYRSLLPVDDWYITSGGSGGGGGYSFAGNVATTPTAPTLVGESTPRAVKAAPWEGKFWADDIDVDAELRSLGHDPSLYTVEQKAAILAAMQKLQGGR